MRFGPRLATSRTSAGLLVAAATATAVAAVVLSAGAAPPKLILVGYGASTTSLGGTPAATTAMLPAISARSAFTISGQVAGLYPGGAVPLQLTISNPQQFAISVNSIVTSAGSSSPSCPGSYLSVTSFTGSLYVTPGGHASTVVQAAMARGAPDSCQGTVFSLQYAGQGQKG